ncbi:BolA family transcriptional regulator [Tistrella mobilis]|jgi:BolA protein|uniref:BolA family protein n=1 Tax=Tistrella mobilis TaxID=171437 RepID=UPI0035587908
MTIRERIETKLTAAFAPERLVITDESDRHAGHAGHQPGGETHFRVEIVTVAFDGLTRVMRQRRVYEVLAEELAERVHALALVTRTPAEAGQSR